MQLKFLLLSSTRVSAMRLACNVANSISFVFTKSFQINDQCLWNLHSLIPICLRCICFLHIVFVEFHIGLLERHILHTSSSMFSTGSFFTHRCNHPPGTKSKINTWFTFFVLWWISSFLNGSVLKMLDVSVKNVISLCKRYTVFEKVSLNAHWRFQKVL